MTAAPAASSAGGSLSRDGSLWCWAARALVSFFAVARIAAAPPHAAPLALARWDGERIAHIGPALRLGVETFGAPGAWYGALGWLGSLTTYLVSLGGRQAVLLETMATALVALAFVEARARRDAGPFLALGAPMLAAACALDAFAPGGGIETAAFSAALAYLLDRPGPRNAALATVLALVWCNTAPEGVLAPALALIFALGVVLEGGSGLERRFALLAFAGTALATFCTPAVLVYPAVASEALRIDRNLVDLVAMHPADVSPLGYRFGFTLAIVTGLALGLRPPRARDTLLFIFAALLALANGAYVATFGVLVAPLFVRSAAALVPRYARVTLERDRVSGTLVLIAVVVATFLAAHTAAGRASVDRSSVADLTALLAADGRAHHLFCANVEWCDEALAGAPRVAVLMDGRVAAYPERTRTTQRDLTKLKPGWRRRLEAARVDALLLRRDRAFATLVASTPGWRLVGSDDIAVLFERTGRR